MECGDAVTRLELGDVFTHGVHDSGNIVTLVDRTICNVRILHSILRSVTLPEDHSGSFHWVYRGTS